MCANGVSPFPLTPGRAAKYLAYEAPVIIHFHPQLLSSLQKEGSYRNRFETGSSSGNPKKNPRLFWEVRCLWCTFMSESIRSGIKLEGVLQSLKHTYLVHRCKLFYALDEPGINDHVEYCTSGNIVDH